MPSHHTPQSLSPFSTTLPPVGSSVHSLSSACPHGSEINCAVIFKLWLLDDKLVFSQPSRHKISHNILTIACSSFSTHFPVLASRQKTKFEEKVKFRICISMIFPRYNKDVKQGIRKRHLKLYPLPYQIHVPSHFSDSNSPQSQIR